MSQSLVFDSARAGSSVGSYEGLEPTKSAGGPIRRQNVAFAMPKPAIFPSAHVSGSEKYF